MKTLFVVILISFIAFYCNDPVNDRPDTPLKKESANIILKSGTSFGMCVGYCRVEIEIKDTGVKFTKSSWNDPAYPTVTISESISGEQSDRLLQLIDIDKLETIKDVYGCPDCADGGAEWIEVEKGSYNKKITIEYGDSLSEIQALLDELRSIRKKFD